MGTETNVAKVVDGPTAGYSGRLSSGSGSANRVGGTYASQTGLREAIFSSTHGHDYGSRSTKSTLETLVSSTGSIPGYGHPIPTSGPSETLASESGPATATASPSESSSDVFPGTTLVSSSSTSASTSASATSTRRSDDSDSEKGDAFWSPFSPNCTAPGNWTTPSNETIANMRKEHAVFWEAMGFNGTASLNWTTPWNLTDEEREQRIAAFREKMGLNGTEGFNLPGPWNLTAEERKNRFAALREFWGINGTEGLNATDPSVMTDVERKDMFEAWKEMMSTWSAKLHTEFHAEQNGEFPPEDEQTARILPNSGFVSDEILESTPYSPEFTPNGYIHPQNSAVTGPVTVSS